MAVLACIDGPGSAPLVPVDTAAFYDEVEPILGERCANPSCHGAAERPLEVYAVHRHRMDDAMQWADEALSAEEHTANLDRARGFAGPPYVLARKALEPDAGGMEHEGGAIYLADTEAEYETLRAWAQGL